MKPEEIKAEYEKVQADLAKVSDDMKAFAEKSQAEVAKAGELSKETRAKVDELLLAQGELQQQLKELNARQLEVEQLAADQKKGGRKERPKSAGELVAEQLQEAGVNSSFRGAHRVSIPRNAITSFDSNDNSIVYPDGRPGIIMGAFRMLTIRDLVAPGTTTSNSIEYVKETGFTNNAGVISENPTGTKAYSDIDYELATAPVRTIAHLFKASRQILDDLPAMRSAIDARARYGLQIAEETQLVYGNGTGNNLHGLIPQAESFVVPTGVSVSMEQRIDRIRLGMLQVNLADYPATGVVLNPIDWALIEMTKDQEGRYIVGQPQDGTSPRLWGLPVVATQAISPNEFLVGAFALAAQIFDRQSIEILVSTENDKDFEKNMVTIRAEERLAFAVYRPEALVTGSLSVAST